MNSKSWNIMMKLFKAILVSFVLLACSVRIFANAPMTVMFDAVLATKERGRLDTTNLENGYNVWVSIVGMDPTSTTVTDTMWSRYYSNKTDTSDKTDTSVQFVNGHCNIIIQGESDNELNENDFNIENPHFKIDVEVDGETLTAYLPIPSTPYAIQAKVAETVLSVPADSITGTFITTVNINADLLVDNGTLFVDHTSNEVGINTRLPEYPLDVQGTVNASAYLINGQEIQEKLSWTKKDNHLYYLDGNVGIATENPQFTLDVSGNVNASEYYRQGTPLKEYLNKVLSWIATNKGDIYFNDGQSKGRVGIGTSTNIVERLNVEGAIKIGSSIQNDPVAGTIEYSSINQDFYGYISDGVAQSLTGARVIGSPREGHFAVWRNNNHVEEASQLVWKENKLGVGTESIPSAHIHIVGHPDNDSYFKIDDQDGDTIFVVKNTGKIGVHTDTPTEDFQVNGVLNAKGYLINGVEFSGSKGSFWDRGNNSQLFYDEGNIGIGTNSPSNLLEVSSVTKNVAITFDIAKQDLFTIGVDASIEDAFVISQGSDLTDPVFVFSGDRIGVGTKEPQANLHVSGNTGFLVTGKFGVGENLPSSGEGVRLLFYPKKAAFRSGYVLGDNWNQEYIGEYSTAIGYDPMASEIASTVIGGFKNKATGRYATVVGGYENEASGAYSFVGGHNAVAATSAVGSFVWADYTPTTNPFQSVVPGQFLIRANNGVGIGTADTERSALTVRRNYPGHNLVMLGSEAETASKIAITTEGQMHIGGTDPGEATLYVASGNVGIGTNQPEAMLTILSDRTDGYIMKINSPARATAPVMVITASGNIGLGVDNPQAGIDLGDGDILATNYLMVDPDDPDSVVILQPSAGSPWADPSDPDTGNGNTYRTMGFVGIGTPSPNSLLELSNRNLQQSPPVITFDLYDHSTEEGIDYFSMGLVTRDSKVYYVIQEGGSLNLTDPIFTISTASVGINIGANDPVGNFQVSGDMVVSGNLAIATTNVDSNVDVLVDGSLSVNELYIEGSKFKPSDTPWRTNTVAQTIFYTSGNVGIGTNNPQTALEVVGTVSTNVLVLKDDFKLEGELETNIIKLQDVTTTNVHTGQLFVQSENLIYVNPEGISKTLSSPLSRSSIPGSGPLAFWIDEQTIGNIPLFWNQDDLELSGTANLSIRNYYEDVNGNTISTNVTFTEKQALGLDIDLDHFGLLSTIPSFTGQDINMSIYRNWGKTGREIVLKGLDISLETLSSANLINNARAVGLYVDVSDLSIDENSDAKRYAALFMGGNVGVGTNTPDDVNNLLDTESGEVLLEVNGVVSANFVDISGVTVTQLLVNKDKNGFSAKKDLAGNTRVGIGTLAPTAELEVVGLVSANSMLLSEGLRAVSMNIGDGSFFVSSNGYIGIGTTEPTNQLEFQAKLNADNTEDFISQRINILVDDKVKLGQSYRFQKNITGLNLSMRSKSVDNQIGEDGIAKGINIDMSQIEAIDSTVKVIGLDVDVSAPENADEVRYAALFNGGFVGIGTEEPKAELHVSGDIKAKNMFLEEALITTRATFDSLVVNTVASLNNVTVNNIFIANDIKANSLQIATGLSVPDASFSTLNSRTVTVNELAKIKNLIVSNNLIAFNGQFSQSLGVGIDAPSSGLEVSGNIRTLSMDISNALTLTDNAILDVNNGQLYVSSEGLVGLGTKSPTAPLDIVVNQEGFIPVFNAANSNTWNPIRLQSNTNTIGSAVGIVLVPDNQSPSRSIGSGIAAIRAADGGSHLAFVTDPNNADPAERLRISKEGYVGIGTDSPSYTLDVVGDTNLQGDVTINGTLSVSNITANGTLVITPDDSLSIEGIASFNSKLIADNALYLKQSSVRPSDVSGYNILYVNADGDLLYVPEGGATQNLTAAFHGKPNYIPFIDENGNLNNDSIIQWKNSDNTFVVGTGNAMVLYEVVTTMDASVSATSSVQSIQMTVADRSGSTATTLKGLDLVIESTPKKTNGSAEFGRLANGETAVGLHVDVSDVVANTTINDISASGYKYAAIFKGANVGIGTETPVAGLHVGPSLIGPALRVDSVYTDSLGSEQTVNNALFVSATGNVGIGTNTPQAQLTIVADNSLDTADSIINVSSGNSTLLVLQKNGNLGIGTNTPSTKLEVAGVVSANTASFQGITATTMNIGENTLVITEEGIIGIGTSNVQGNLTFYKALNEVLSDPFVSQKIEMIINGAQGPAKPFHLDRDLTGIELVMKSETTNDTLQSAQIATGVSINMSELGISAADAKLVGLDVNVGSGDNRYAAIFLGGNVGIGTANPTVELAVSGDIKANSIELDGDMIANSVTMNTLIVNESITVNGTIEIENLIAQSVSANDIEVLGMLEVSTASFEVITVNGLAKIDRLGVGAAVSSVADELFVSGSSKFIGNLEVLGTLNATAIQASENITITPGNGIVMVNGSVSANSYLRLDQALLLKTDQTHNTSIGEGQLFVDSQGNLFFYRVGMNTPINLTGSYSGVSGHIPFYDNGGNISSDTTLVWDSNNNTLRIGTSNSEILTRMEVRASINETVVGDIAAQHINFNIGERTAASAATIKGLDIIFNSSPLKADDNFDFGRLAEGETAIGLNVDMRNLEANYFDGGSVNYNGYKYAGIFRGGNVGIGTDRPDAALHVGSELEGTAFRVDTVYKVNGEDNFIENAFVVSATGNVGVGIANPQSQFVIQSDSSTGLSGAVFQISSGNTDLLLVQNDGKVGIGTSSPSAALDVNGLVSANQAVFSGISASTLNINNGTLVISSNGEIAIGTENTNGSLRFYKELNTAAITPFTSQRIDLLINGANGPSNPFHLDRDLTGLELLIKSDTVSDTLDGSQIATGVSINMSSLVVKDTAVNTKVIGLDVNVGTGDNRYAALLLGGNVGIGTANPTAELTVSGDIKATSIELSGDMLANNVTMNSLVVNSGITVNGTIQVDSLIANNVSANNIEIIGKLEVSTASFEVITVNRLANFNALGIGISSEEISDSLVVSGNSKFYGDIDIIGTLNASVFTSDDVIRISPGGEGLIVNNAVSVNSDLRVDGALILKKGESKIVDNNRAQLFVNDSGDLVYYKGSGTSEVNLTGLFTGEAGRIPFYDSIGNINSDSLMTWDDTTNKLTIGTSNLKLLSTFEVVASINSNVSSDLALQKIDLKFDRRVSSGSSAQFKGLDINFASSPLQSANPFDFGRIAAGETAIGLNVDLSNLIAAYSDESSTFTYNGHKYAAIFKGGNVGVGTTSPKAALHVVGEIDQAAFNVDANYFDGVSDVTREHTLFVSSEGRVGINNNEPSAMLTITPQNNQIPLLDISNDTNNYLYLQNDGKLGIGFSSPTHVLDVSGNFRVGSNSNSNLLVVSENVGIGTNVPSADLHIVGDFRVDSETKENILFVDNSTGRVGINTDSPQMSLSVEGVVESVKGNVSGTIIDNSTDRGFLTRVDEQEAFFGLMEESDGSYSTQLRWGASDADMLLFTHSNGTSTKNVMAIHPSLANEGRVGIGIGDEAPEATLHVSGNMRISNASDNDVFVVSSNGFVGVGTANPTTLLDVAGNMSAKSLTITEGAMTVSTLNIKDALYVTRVVTENTTSDLSFAGHKIDVLLSHDVNTEINGLDVSLTALPDPTYDGQIPYTIWNSAAYGLKVDVSNIKVADPTDDGEFASSKYAAAFIGGNVGVGTLTPEATLHVKGPFNRTIAKFGTTASELSIKDYDQGRIGFLIKNIAMQTPEDEVLVLGPDRVGIGVVPENLESASLVVNGDVRVGVVRKGIQDTVGSGSDVPERYGSKLLLSGGPRLNQFMDSDNRDELFLARYNKDKDVSELRVNFSTISVEDPVNSADLPGDIDVETGLPNGKDKFTVGFDNESTYTPVLSVHNNGRVGIANNQVNFQPNNLLHIKGQSSGLASERSSHLVMIENVNTGGANSLAIVHSGITGSGDVISDDNNFVTFMIGSIVIGEIEGNNGDIGSTGGVRYKTGGGDYAEYLEKRDYTEEIEKGDIVGVDNSGKISKNTTDAQQFLVKSTSAAVAGNWPGENKEGYELIAFFGQVKIKVRGVVNTGDFIVPSGHNDGTGIAVAAEDIHRSKYKDKIIGRAWESSSEMSVKKIHAAVGFAFGLPSLKEEIASLSNLENEMAELKEENQSLKTHFDSILTKQDADIEKLMKEIENLKNR